MVNIDINQAKDALPKNSERFDPSYVTRYAILASIVRQAVGKGAKVLDAGGYNGALRELLPEYDITILDVIDDDELENYVKADGAHMPFHDDTFDLVVSSDTLEHIVEKDRTNFINELVRVSKNFVVIGAPFKGQNIQAAELIADSVYQGMTGQSYIWLKEHAEYVLPDKNQLKQILKTSGLKHKEFSHGTLWLWGMMLAVNAFIAENIRPVNNRIAEKIQKANKQYLNDCAFIDFPSDGYRTFVVASRQDFQLNVPKPDQAKIFANAAAQAKNFGRAFSDFNKENGAVTDRNRYLETIYEEYLRLKDYVENSRAVKAARFATGIKKRIKNRRK